ncbi:dihydroorotase family protein [Bacteroidota bacterium]
MKVLIKSALILDQTSDYSGKKHDILINNGRIEKIGNKLPAPKTVINGKNLHVSIGWFDMRANFFDPGYEHKEDIYTGCEAAKAGGFTGVALIPNTNPPVQSKNDIAYIISKSAPCLVDLFPYGSVTVDNKGEELTEMLDQDNAGAVAFTDGDKPVWHTDIFLKSLLYLKKFKGLLIDIPEDKWLTMFGTMHEGTVSTTLGMKGLPRIAEEIIVERDIRLLEYAGGRLHLSNISTGESVRLIKQAKRKGLEVTCDIAAHQLVFDDSSVSTFDANYKVYPPFREKSDIKELMKGIEEGVIDVIVTSHTPHDEECKKLEFDHADFGITGLQTFYPVMNKVFGNSYEVYLDKITVTPRNILNIPVPKIAKGAMANLTVFDPKMEWTLDESTNKSKSRFNPFWGQKLKGKIIATINNGQVHINE